MISAEHAGFRMHYFRDLANAGTRDLRVVRLGRETEFVSSPACPGCATPLTVFYTLVSASDGLAIRRGVCESCGYIGYLEKPGREWFDRFYEEEWDNAAWRNLDREVKAPAGPIPERMRSAVRRAHALGLDPAKTICDIGCGAGEAMAEFKQLGYTRVVGVESSRHRGELARRKYGFPVLTGSFERAAGRLRRERPIQLLFSFHVLEHVFDPREFIRAAAALQEENEFLFLVTPHAMDQSVLALMFWFPHLHAFTPLTIERMLNAYGYEIVWRDERFPGPVAVAARKTKNPRPRIAPSTPAVLPDVLRRFRRDTAIDEMQGGARRFRLSWKTRKWRGSMRPALSSRTLDRAGQAIERVYDFFSARLAGRFSNQRSCIVSPLTARLTRPEDSPIEVQYEGPIEVLIR